MRSEAGLKTELQVIIVKNGTRMNMKKIPFIASNLTTKKKATTKNKRSGSNNKRKNEAA